MARIYGNVGELVGNTPLMELGNLARKEGLKARILAKLEYLNPAGSVKDRVGKAMIEAAEKEGKLKEGGVIIEPTSGNTGIGLAAVAASKGYQVILTMPETMSKERRNILKAYGAKIVLTPGDEGMAGSIKKAEELAGERAAAGGLGWSVQSCDVFPNTISHPASNEKIRSVCRKLGIPLRELPAPHRSSEDFGCYTQRIPGAFFEIGSGENCPELHTVGMDFPDAILETAVDVFLGLIGRE